MYIRYVLIHNDFRNRSWKILPFKHSVGFNSINTKKPIKQKHFTVQSFSFDFEEPEYIGLCMSLCIQILYKYV